MARETSLEVAQEANINASCYLHRVRIGAAVPPPREEHKESLEANALLKPARSTAGGVRAI
jgi:hypothetical protein